MPAVSVAVGTRFEFHARREAPVHIVPVVRPVDRSLAASLNEAYGGVVSTLATAMAQDEPGAVMHTVTPNRNSVRLLLVHLGDRPRLQPHQLRQAAGAAANWLIQRRITDATLITDGLANVPFQRPLAEWAIGMAIAGFRATGYRSPDPKRPERIRIGLSSLASGRRSERNAPAPALAEAREGLAIAEAVNYARALSHAPANVIHPVSLAAEARSLGRKYGLRVTVLGPDRLAQMGLNGLLAVGRGAEFGPQLIRLDYRGQPSRQEADVLVGKAITFDTGGYSIKPADGLEGLKFDKCGGMNVLGVMRAVAELKLKRNVIGLVAAAENAISDRAYRPGDILPMKGRSVEIISTDAEGRLVLADALWYAQEHCRPATLIDIATLTGGVNIALGKVAAGLMSNNDALAAALTEAGQRTRERLWQLPLWDDYRELIRGADADIKNSAGKRDAHAIVGGMFLREFVKPQVPWAHLDIAAVSTADMAGAKTATGFGVRLLIDFLRGGGGDSDGRHRPAANRTRRS